MTGLGEESSSKMDTIVVIMVYDCNPTEDTEGKVCGFQGKNFRKEWYVFILIKTYNGLSLMQLTGKLYFDHGFHYNFQYSD